MATITPAADSDCGISKFKKVLPQQLPQWAQIVKQTLAAEPIYMRDKLTLGANVNIADDDTFLVKRSGGSGVMKYRDLNAKAAYTNEGCEIETVDGVQQGLSECSALDCSEINASVVDFGDDNCATKRQVFDTGSGHYRRSGEDREAEGQTPIRCLRDLLKYTPENQTEALMSELDDVRKRIARSEDFEILRYVIENGESHVVVGGAQSIDGVRPTLTSGGFQWRAPEDIDALTIWQLLQIREEIGGKMLSLGMINSMDEFNMPIMITRQAWEDAMERYEIVRATRRGTRQAYSNFPASAGVRVSLEPYGMGNAGRSVMSANFEDKITAVFTDDPLRGYLKQQGTLPDGTPRGVFVPVPRFVDVPASTIGERGEGLIQVENAKWREDCYECDGITYPMLEMACYLHPDAFSRHYINNPAAPAGVNQLAADFTIKMMTDEAVQHYANCDNARGDLYYYYFHVMTRFMKRYPELASCILYRYVRDPGHNSGLTPVGCNKPAEAVGTFPMAEPEVCEEVSCSPAGCGATVTCVEADNITSLDPCGGPVTTAFLGDAHEMRVNVCRDENCAEVADATIDYSLIDGTADAANNIVPAVYDTDYVAVDENGTALPATGQITFAAGESGCKAICIQILNAAATLPAADPTGPCCEENSETPQLARFSVKLDSAAGTTLGDCTETFVDIENASGN